MTGKRIKIFLVVVLFAQLSAAVSISENRVSGIKKTDGRKIIAAKTDLFNAAKKYSFYKGFGFGNSMKKRVPCQLHLSQCV